MNCVDCPYYVKNVSAMKPRCEGTRTLWSAPLCTYNLETKSAGNRA